MQFFSKRTHSMPCRRAATPTPSPQGPAPTTAISIVSCTLRFWFRFKDHSVFHSLRHARTVQRDEPQPALEPALELIAVVRAEGQTGLAGRDDEATRAVQIAHV